MIVSSHLSTNRTLELLDQLKETVAQFTARERDLDRSFQSKVNAERERLKAALADLDADLAAKLAQAEADAAAARRNENAAYERRRARISDAWKSSKTQALARIGDQEGRRKYKLQTETMQATRNRKDGLAATEEAYEEFKASLHAEDQVLLTLEESARQAFRGYGTFRRLLEATPAAPATASDEYQLINELRHSRDLSQSGLERFSKLPLPRFFKALPWWYVLPCLIAASVPLASQLGVKAWNVQNGISTAVGVFIALFALYWIGRKQGAPAARETAAALVNARRLHSICLEKCETRHTSETARIEQEFQDINQRVNQEWGQAVEQAGQMTEPALAKVDEHGRRATQKFEQQHRNKLEALAREHTRTIDFARRDAEALKHNQNRLAEERETKWTGEFQSQWRALQTDWEAQIHPIYETATQAITQAGIQFPEWSETWVKTWAPPVHFLQTSPYGRLNVDVAQLSDGLPKDRQLALPGPARFAMPLNLVFPEQGSILFETFNEETEAVADSLNDIMLRLLSQSPPGRVNFTILDPVGLGQSFAGVMHLADYEEHLINSRIWTQSSQIEQKLADLNEHMEKVIQMYLRNEYNTIAEYNEQAGNIAEKYHFLVVANFPANFTDTAIRRLLSIAASGARCGVFTLIHWDHRHPITSDFRAEDLRKSSICISADKQSRMALNDWKRPGVELVLEPSPHPDLAVQFIHTVGRRSKDSNRVEVPFSYVAPPQAQEWTLETTEELRVPIGRTGATKLQYLAIGRGTRQHGLIAGKTGSGKSTLFHVIITNLALWCTPEQVEFYLVDFKKGVEFKCYATAHLPHARVIAIESDREFGLSVLERVDGELKRRGDLFRKLGAQDIAGYKRAGGRESIPRTLLLIDEFQEFFVEDDKISQSAALLLDRIVRQGRAFGIHVILGSQTLGGAYSMARATLGQMVIRIALQCNEADAYLIMDEGNPAPRLLSRPGEAIYNDAAGALEGNSPFQTVWLPDAVREKYLNRVLEHVKASGRNYPGPIVFEGDAPADVRENPLLKSLLLAPAIKTGPVTRIWLGEPNSIKGPTEATFQKQAGNHLLIVGQREEAILAIFAASLISLAAQHPVGAARFYLADATMPGSAQREFLERVARCIPHGVTFVKNGDLPEVMVQIAAEIRGRAEETDAQAPAIYLFIGDVQKFSRLRYEDDFGFATDDATLANPSVILNNLVCEGSARGFHAIVSCDSYNSVTRHFNRKTTSEFAMRALFQMSANDSASLIDSPKAANLGLHRALLFNDKESYIEVFRPYALPAGEWLEEAARNLARLAGKQG